jgi:hypothetical protein
LLDLHSIPIQEPAELNIPLTNFPIYSYKIIPPLRKG